MPGFLILAKHGSPVLDPRSPPREWLLSPKGEEEAARLADRLRPYLPLRIVSSTEPKALRTAQIAAGRLRVAASSNEGLAEIDRPALPILSAGEHRNVNAGIFAAPDRAVLGSESANAALDRFTGAVRVELDRGGSGNLAAVTHGTVIALFVAAHNDIDAFALWADLECGDHVVLEAASLRLVDEGRRAAP